MQPLAALAHPRTVGRTIAGALGVAAVLIGGALFLRAWRDVPLYMMVGDPASVLGGRFYIGWFSQIGIFFWAATAGLCLFSALLLGGLGAARELVRFLLVAGVLTLVLAFDDLFQLHEEVFPYFGVDELVIFIAYALFVLYFVIRFRALILRTDYLVLCVAFACFATSIFLDQVKLPLPALTLWENGAKQAGVVMWLAYFSRVCALALWSHAAPSDSVQDPAPAASRGDG